MNWFKKFLEETEDKTTDEVVEEFKKEFPLHAVPKETFNQKASELQAKEEQLTELNTEIEKLSNSNANADELKKTIEDLKLAQEEIKTAHEQKLREIKTASILEKELLKAGAKDIDIAKATLKDFQPELDGEEIKGLSDAIEKARESYSYAFKSEEKEGFTGTGGAKGNSRMKADTKMTKEDIEAIKDPIARQKAIAENIELYQ